MTDNEDRSGKKQTLPEGYVIADRYELIRPLGFGGMGVVYLATDRLLRGETIAIKVLHTDYFDEPNLKQRFLREVQLMRRINHVNVVRTFDLGTDRQFIFFTMEYVPGKPLDYMIHEGSIRLKDIPGLMMQMCEGLQAIHDAGVVHRDFKPANILVLPDGTLRITDFGVARPETSNLTTHDEIVGSVCYLAPEIWRGDKPTHAVDLYSLGVILYELTTGNVPFDAGTPAELMRLHLNREPVPPKELNPAIPNWLNRLALMLLDKNPAKRPKSAKETFDYIRLRTSGSSSAEEEGGRTPVVDESFIEQLEKKSQDLTQSAENEAFSAKSTSESLDPEFRPARPKTAHKKNTTFSGRQSGVRALFSFFARLAAGFLTTACAAAGGAVISELLVYILPAYPRAAHGTGGLLTALVPLLVTAAALTAPFLGISAAAGRFRAAGRMFGAGFVFFAAAAAVFAFDACRHAENLSFATAFAAADIVQQQLFALAFLTPHTFLSGQLVAQGPDVFYPAALVPITGSWPALVLTAAYVILTAVLWGSLVSTDKSKRNPDVPFLAAALGVMLMVETHLLPSGGPLAARTFFGAKTYLPIPSLIVGFGHWVAVLCFTAAASRPVPRRSLAKQ